MKKQPWERLDDAFAPTPQAFHAQVERKLYQVTRGQAAERIPRRGWRRRSRCWRRFSAARPWR